MVGILTIAGLVMVITGIAVMGGIPLDEWDYRAKQGAIIGGSGLLLLIALMLFS